MVDSRFHAFKILQLCAGKNLRLDAARDVYLNQAFIPARYRQRVLVLTNEITRFKGRLNAVISMACERSPLSLDREVLIVLQIAAYELLMDDRTPDYAAISSAVNLIENISGKRPKGFVNACCRNIQRVGKLEKKHFMTASDWYSIPKWMFTRWVKRYGVEKTDALCNCFNIPARLTLRRNPERISEEQLIEALEKENISIAGIDGSDRFYHVTGGGSFLVKTEIFRKGFISIQDRAAGAIVEVLDPQPGETVLDVCAAPGTKSVYIAERMNNTGTVYSSDKDPDRVAKGVRDLDRLSLRNITWEVKDAAGSDFPMADRILIDAPCSGTGVIQRRPDIRWNRQHDDLRSFAGIQKSILENMKKFVKPGGLIVYATCSLEPEENWLVVDSFLKFNENFALEMVDDPRLISMVNKKGHLETFPPDHHMDGMYAVKLRRIK